MTHELKIWPQYFEPVVKGIKTFEVRKNDRLYAVGDTLVLKEWARGRYTGRECVRKVTYILRGDERILPNAGGMVIMAIADVKPVEKSYWTTKRTEQHDGEWYCANCGYEPIVFEGSRYCPNCGARMDGEKE